MIKYFSDLFISQRFYFGLLACIAAFIIAFYFPIFYIAAVIIFFLFFFFFLADYFLLFFTKKFILAQRISSERLSNGDENKFEIVIKNEFTFPVIAEVIDELPEQFQERKWKNLYH